MDIEPSSATTALVAIDPLSGIGELVVVSEDYLCFVASEGQTGASHLLITMIRPDLGLAKQDHFDDC